MSEKKRKRKENPSRLHSTAGKTTIQNLGKVIPIPWRNKGKGIVKVRKSLRDVNGFSYKNIKKKLKRKFNFK